jgi:hypothetical protein
MPRPDDEVKMTRFQEVADGLAKTAAFKPGDVPALDRAGLSVIDAFFLYNLIVFDNKSSKNTMTTLFNQFYTADDTYSYIKSYK